MQPWNSGMQERLVASRSIANAYVETPVSRPAKVRSGRLPVGVGLVIAANVSLAMWVGCAFGVHALLS
jgi:hypothetical protein